MKSTKIYQIIPKYVSKEDISFLNGLISDGYQITAIEKAELDDGICFLFRKDTPKAILEFN